MACNPPTQSSDPVASGYRGFGSFHSDSVEALIAQSDEEYTQPSLPFDWSPSLPFGDLSSLDLGEAAKEHFLLEIGGGDDSWTFLNHGAFGAPVRAGMELADAWRQRCERQPLRFADRELLPHMVAVLRRVAGALSCNPRDLALVPNATAGLSAVILGLPLTQTDVVFSLDIGYGSVKKMIAEACRRSGATHVEAHVRLPLSGPEEVVRVVEQQLPEGAALAVFDAMTSNTALKLPIEQLAALCKSRGVPVLIDGAHALGQLPDVRPSQLDGCTYYVANFHKWGCSPRGAAMLWADSATHHSVRPPVVSHGWGSGFTSKFIWDGNRDYSPYLSLPAVLSFWDALGWDRMRRYNHDLVCSAAQMLADRWHTRTLAPPVMCGSMALVELPPLRGLKPLRGLPPLRGLKPPTGAGGQFGSTEAKAVQDLLYHEHRIEVPAKFVAGRLYLRISAHIYNTMADYERLGDVVANRMMMSAGEQAR